MKSLEEEVANYVSKKTDLFEAYCSCGKTIYSFVDGDYRVICKNCGKSIFHVFCEKCGSGFAYPESAKEIDLVTYKWKCPDCKQDLELPHEESGGYYWDEIPQEAKKIYQSYGLPWWGKLLIYAFLALMFWFFKIKLK